MMNGATRGSPARDGASPFLLTGPGVGESRLSEWYRHCESLRIPYVVIRVCTPFAQVELDLLPVGRELEPAAVDEALALVKRHGIKGSKFRGGTVHLRMRHLPVAAAEPVALALLELVRRRSKPLR